MPSLIGKMGEIQMGNYIMLTEYLHKKSARKILVNLDKVYSIAQDNNGKGQCSVIRLAQDYYPYIYVTETIEEIYKLIRDNLRW